MIQGLFFENSILKAHKIFFLIGLIAFFTAFFFWRDYYRPPDISKIHSNNINPGMPEPKSFLPGKIELPLASELRLLSDGEHKRKDFWLEQALEFLPPALSAVGDKNELFDYYISLNTETMAGLRVRFMGNRVLLERITAKTAATPTPGNEILAQGAMRALSTGEWVLGVLWRKGELSVWQDSYEILRWSPKSSLTHDGSFSELQGPSAIWLKTDAIRPGLSRALALGAIQFEDDFMRSSENGIWRPLAGRWELTAQAFPERSANPFSMRAVFGTERPADDRLNHGRLRDNGYGLGLQISPFEGTLHIARITGGSPAARAGLAEDDIFLEIDGNQVRDLQPWQAYQLLTKGIAGSVHLKILRPGEKKIREFMVTPDQFRWGTPSEGVPIQPIINSKDINGDECSLIIAGEAGWSDYAAEVAVKALGSGGMGLAVGVLSDKDYLLFRWRGPFSRNSSLETAALQTDKIQLVRVSSGTEVVLAERAAGYQPYEFYRMKINWSGDHIACSIDDTEVLIATVPGMKRGQVGLYAMKGDPVFFDDVRVSSDREALLATHHPQRKLNTIFTFEEDMQAWANPASEWRRDLKTGWAIHQAHFPGEQVMVIHKPLYEELTVAMRCTQNLQSMSGPQLIIKGGKASLGGIGWTTTLADIGTAGIQCVSIRASARDVEVEIDGTRLRSSLDNSKIIAPASIQGPSDRIAIQGLKNLGDPNTVHVSSSNTLEYTFDSAPTDWSIASGRWGLLNKWICDPRWSWFGGRSKTLACIWNKSVFSGDISIEAHVALMMQKDDPPFERPGDYNMTICGDGSNLDSGYTLIFGGDNNSWTRLYRKGELVAESTKEEHRLFSDRIKHPDKPELHQRWFHLKFEKFGNTVAFYRDGVQAFSYVDPHPMNGGRVAFWTVDNGFLLSRVRIAHSGMSPAPFKSRNTSLYNDARVVNIFDGEASTSVQLQELPKQIQKALAAPSDLFVPAESPPLENGTRGIPGSTPPTPFQERESAYRVVNGSCGGPFALQWKTLAIDPENRGILRFAYCIEPGAKVDLYLIDVRGQNFDPRHQTAFRWRLTGPAESDEYAPLVGEIPGVHDDGLWHAVQYDLQPSWRALWQRRGFQHTRSYSMRVMIGNIDNHGYLLAGMGGNHAGAAYSITDISVLSPKDSDTHSPTVERVIWPYDAEGDGRSIVVLFNDAGGSGIQENSVQAILNNISVPREAVEINALKQSFRIDLLKLGAPPLADNSSLSLKLLGFQDRAQNPSQDGFNAVFTYNSAEAKNANKPVEAPSFMLSIPRSIEQVPGSTALALSDISPVQPTITRLQQSTDAPPWAPRGLKSSIQVVNTTDGSAFGFHVNRMAYSLTHWPYLAIEYKIPAEMPVNLHFNDENGNTHALYLTDLGDGRDPESHNLTSHFGPPEDFIADGTWRRTIIPLQRMFLSTGINARLNNPSVQVNAFSLHDNGWQGNRRSMQYWIHKIQPIPAGRSKDMVINWEAMDIAGIAGYASCIDDHPDTDPVGRQELAPGEFLGVALKEGWNYVHVRVKNGAGIWSEPAHQPFVIDHSPPKIVRTEPANLGTCSGQSLKIYFEEVHGIDIKSLKMTINGLPVHAWTPGVTFDVGGHIESSKGDAPEGNTSSSGRFSPHPFKDTELNSITFNAQIAGTIWADHARIEVEIQALNDLLGNGMTEPYHFSFDIDRSSDQSGPKINYIRFVSDTEVSAQHRQIAMETSFGLNFEEHLGHVRAMRDCQLEWINDSAQAYSGKSAVRITSLEDDADVQVMVHKNSWYFDQMPLLQFDYKADPGMRIDILVEVMGEWGCIRFTGDGMAPDGGKAIGAVEAVIADGNWQHASIDLGTLIVAAWPDLPVRIANSIILSAHGSGGCKRGSSIVIDNLDMAQARGDCASIEWKSEEDPSGLRGYSFVLDRDASSLAPEIVNQTSAISRINTLTGVWFAHVRACDQAGNWGPTRTLRVDFGK